MIISKLKYIIRQVLFRYIYLLIPSFKETTNNDVGITTCLYHNAVKMSIYSLSSFFYYSGLCLPIVAIEDGSLTTKDKQTLSKKFNIKFLNINYTGKKMHSLYKDFQRFLYYRYSPHSSSTKYKFDTLVCNPFKRFIYIEPDTLFYRKPTEIINWVVKNSNLFLNLTYDRRYFDSYKREDLDYNIRILLNLDKFKMVSKNFNSGILCIPDKNALLNKRLNEIFRYFTKINYIYSHCCEETALAILLKGVNSKSLPSKKYLCPVYPREYQKARSSPLLNMMHYIGNLKNYFYRDAVKLIFRNRFFINKYDKCALFEALF